MLFSALGAAELWSVNLGGTERAERLEAVRTANLFPAGRRACAWARLRRIDGRRAPIASSC
ncbi:MAG: hypothetical protein R2909_02305 [Gemmatimonadales bacterium]